jgi:uncharacterized protein (DUF1015 family)
MVDIHPFPGITPNPACAQEVAALPYDVLNYEEAKVLVDNNPRSFLRVEKSEVDFGPDVPSASAPVFQQAAANLAQMLREGTLMQDTTPCFYLYQQQMGDHLQTGLVAGSAIADLNAGKIKKHEHTRMDKEDERTFHIDTVNANTGAVFLTYQGRADMDNLVNRLTGTPPEINFVADDGIRHALWKVADSAVIAEIETIFRDVPATYIADGHHRAVAAARVQAMRQAKNPAHTGREACNFFLSVIFPDTQVRIMDYNRVLKDLNGLSEADLLQQLEAKFSVEKLGPVEAEAARPARTHEFAMYLAKNWYRLTINPALIPADPVNSLDAALLQHEVLAPLFGIDDPRSSTRIDFVGGSRGLGELVRRCEAGYALAFALFPVSMAELVRVADSGAVMPPKSTWFEPKLRSGMVVRSLAD